MEFRWIILWLLLLSPSLPPVEQHKQEISRESAGHRTGTKSTGASAESGVTTIGVLKQEGAFLATFGMSDVLQLKWKRENICAE